MEVTVINEEGLAAGTIEVVDALFTTPVNKNVLYEALKNELANKRQGTHSTKSRSEVSGGSKKPWRQKGTGRARAGTRRSPLWPGGGKVHTPKPRDYSYHLPRKVKRLAYLSVFSHHYGLGGIKVVDDFAVSEPKTKRMAEFLKKTKKDGTRKITFIVHKNDTTKESYKNLLCSLRNIRDLRLVNAESISVHPLFYADEVYITKSAMAKLNDTLSKSK